MVTLSLTPSASSEAMMSPLAPPVIPAAAAVPVGVAPPLRALPGAPAPVPPGDPPSPVPVAEGDGVPLAPVPPGAVGLVPSSSQVSSEPSFGPPSWKTPSPEDPSPEDPSPVSPGPVDIMGAPVVLAPAPDPEEDPPEGMRPSPGAPEGIPLAALAPAPSIVTVVLAPVSNKVLTMSQPAKSSDEPVCWSSSSFLTMRTSAATGVPRPALLAKSLMSKSSRNMGLAFISAAQVFQLNCGAVSWLWPPRILLSDRAKSEVSALDFLMAVRLAVSDLYSNTASSRKSADPDEEAKGDEENSSDGGVKDTRGSTEELRRLSLMLRLL